MEMTGEHLRERRERLGLTQEQLAAELGVAVNTIWRWENNRMKIGAARAIDLALEALSLSKRVVKQN